MKPIEQAIKLAEELKVNLKCLKRSPEIPELKTACYGLLEDLDEILTQPL